MDYSSVSTMEAVAEKVAGIAERIFASHPQPNKTIVVRKHGTFEVAKEALSPTQCGWAGSTVFGWAAWLESLPTELEDHGYVMNNGELQGYWDSMYNGQFGANFPSCELTALHAAHWFAQRMTELGHTKFRVEVGVVNPFGTVFTACIAAPCGS